MIGDVTGTKCLKLIWDDSEAIEGLLNIFILKSFEAVEDIAKNINSRVTLCWDCFIDFGRPIPDKLSSFQSTHSSILSFTQMATCDILRLRVELLESLHIGSVQWGWNRGNTIFHNIPEIVVNCFKMHSQLILPVGVVCAIEGRTLSRDLDHTCGLMETWYSASVGDDRWFFIHLESALYRLEGGWIGDFYKFITEEFQGEEIPKQWTT